MFFCPRGKKNHEYGELNVIRSIHTKAIGVPLTEQGDIVFHTMKEHV
jgi:hypothetical protein